MVGIPGVGRSTLLTTMVEILKNHKKNVIVINYGTLMFDVAKENGLENRDDLRKLSVTEQQRLQKIAAEKIATHEEEVVIIDTHAFISSPEGYYPGLPEHVLKIIKPSNFVSVSAKPEEIYNRIDKLIAQGLVKQGGLGKYIKSGFVHYDIRGIKARWEG